MLCKSAAQGGQRGGWKRILTSGALGSSSGEKAKIAFLDCLRPHRDDRAISGKAPGYLRKVSRKPLNLSFDDDVEKKKEVLCALCVWGNSCEL